MSKGLVVSINGWYSPGETRHQALQAIPPQPIPIKGPNQRYAKIVIPDGLAMLDFGEAQFRPEKIEGREIAADIARGLEPHGVFAAAGDEPTEEELKVAEDRMLAFYREQLADGDSIWARTGDPKLISLHMRTATKALSVRRDWAIDNAAMVQCEACRELIVPTAIKCPRCTAVRDWEKARVMGLVSPEQYAFAKGVVKTAEPEMAEVAVEAPKRPRGNPNWVKKSAE